MFKKFKEFIKTTRENLTEESKRRHTQFLWVFLIMSILTTGMTVFNYYSGYRLLTQATALFAICNFINLILTFKKFKLEISARILFALEVMLFYTFLLVGGEPEGFAVLWVPLLPIGGMLLYGRKWGSITSIIQLVIFMYFLWDPIGRTFLQYEYPTSFEIRFPILYSAYFAIGFLFETIRNITNQELKKSRDNFQMLSHTCQLTGLGNETAYIEETELLQKQIEDGNASFGVVVMDVNGIKNTNDRIGHRYGCHLIVSAGKALPSIFPNSKLFHIGGDEFIAILEGDDLKNSDQIFKKFVDELEYKHIAYEDHALRLSVAYGYSVFKDGDEYRDVFQRADGAMYENKKKVKTKYKIPGR